MKAAKAKLRCGFLSDVFAGCSPQLEVNLRGRITETHTHTRSHTLPVSRPPVRAFLFSASPRPRVTSFATSRNKHAGSC